MKREKQSVYIEGKRTAEKQGEIRNKGNEEK